MTVDEAVAERCARQEHYVALVQSLGGHRGDGEADGDDLPGAGRGEKKAGAGSKGARRLRRARRVYSHPFGGPMDLEGACAHIQAVTKVVHANSSGHPVACSAEPGECWLYCYPEDVFVEY
jgi:hypothetical protein